VGVRRIGANKKTAARGATKTKPEAGSGDAGDDRAAVLPSSIKLPRKRKPALTELCQFSGILYARPKFGKTTFFSTFPDILFLTTEPGTKGLEIFEFNGENGGVTDWAVMLRAIKLLETSKRFANVVIDTADEAYAMCMDHTCKRSGVEHPHDADDYGKTWNKVSRAFTDALNRIARTGRGLYLTSHVRERVIETAGGGKFTRIGPSLTGQAEKTILSFVDLIWYGEIVRGGRRLVITDGDEYVTAGSRKRGVVTRMPAAILLPEDESRGYEHFAATFRGDVDGAEAADIWATMTATKAVSKVIDKTRARVAEEGGDRG
jgi:hypothetical protein